MKIVISPAKKIQTDGGFLPKSQPVFLNQAEELWSYLHSLDQVDLEKVWRANAKITEEARQMLIEAFIDEAFQTIENPSVREWIKSI